MDLPESLGSVDGLIKRFKTAAQKKQLWDDHMRECYELALPQRETFHVYQPGQKKNNDRNLFDSTAIDGVQAYASRIQATLVPPWRKWSLFIPGSEIPEDQYIEVQKGLDIASEIVFDHLNHSNFASQSHESFLDLSVSTGILTCEEGDGDQLLQFNAVPLAEAYLEEGPHGTIETIWRKQKVKYRLIDRIWPGAELTQKMKDGMVKNPDKEIFLIEGSIYEPKARVYHRVVMSEGEKEAIFHDEDGATSPWIAFREYVIPGETYGRGRVMTLLPDIKTANKVVEFSLRNAALSVAGIYTAVDDSVINPYSIKLEPNSIIPVGSNSTQNPTLKPLERAGSFEIGQLLIDEIRNRINRMLFNEPFGEVDSAVKTATEFNLRHQEMIQSSGSAFARLQTEFVEKMIRRVVHILVKNGKLPNIKVDGKEVSIKHTSPLSNAQDQEDLMAIQHYLEMTAPLGPEIVALGTKVEDLPELIGKKLGVDAKMLRTEGERNEIKEAAAQAAAAQAEAQPQQGATGQ